MADKNATLKLPDGNQLEFPVLNGTTGPDVVDIRTLYGKSGMFTYDPGFMSTASCTSAITFIDVPAPSTGLSASTRRETLPRVLYLLPNGEPDRKQKD